MGVAKIQIQGTGLHFMRHNDAQLLVESDDPTYQCPNNTVPTGIFGQRGTDLIAMVNVSIGFESAKCDVDTQIDTEVNCTTTG